MNFLENLCKFLFTPSTIDLRTMEFGYLIFGVASAFIGLIVVIFDSILWSVRRRSLLGLSYSGVKIFVVWGLWGVGAGIGGFMGGIINIFQMNLQACASVGIGWPLILPRIFESTMATEETQSETKEE